MNFFEAGMFVAVGFVPMLIALELVYRMGRAIGKRGEILSLHKTIARWECFLRKKFEETHIGVQQ